MSRSPLRQFGLLALLTLAYVTAGRLGLLLAFVNESASAVWPPTGLAFGTLLLVGLGAWPFVATGAFVVNFMTSGAIGASLVIAAGNTLEAVVGVWLTNRFAEGVETFERTSCIVRFTLCAAMFATAIAATVGSATLVLTGSAATADAVPIWFTWWLGDAVGAMVVTPLVVLWWRPSAGDRSSNIRRGEAVALVACLAAVLTIVFFQSPIATAHYPVAFVIVPIVLWTAFRFGSRATATMTAAVSAVAVAGTLRDLGPFVRSSPNESLILLQAFIGVTTVMMLSVAAEVRRRRTSEMQIQSLNDALERRIVERTDELRTVNQRLMEAQQVANVGSWEWDVGSNRLWWSDELFRMYGVTTELAGYEQFLSCVHPEDRGRVDAVVRQAMTDGQSFGFEHRIVRPDGSVRTLYGAGHVQLDASGRPRRMMGIGHDITERKQAEEERAQLMHEQAVRREAEAAGRAKDEFLAILSHELRTPLNAALGWSRILSDEVPTGNSKLEKAVDAIHRNLLIQSRLVSDILDVSRMATGALVMEQGDLDLRSVVDASLDMVRASVEARNATVECRVTGDGFAVAGDGPRLQQVFWNLLSNAVRFGPDGGVVTVTLTREPRHIVVAVTDDGPGIDPAFLDHVFEPFRQADSSPRRQHDGLGLGLSIARHIVERHGGTIAAANRQGGGAVFTVRLPPRTP